MADTDTFTVRSEPRKRDQNSDASTPRQPVLALGGAPSGDDAVVRWRVECDAGRGDVAFGATDAEEEGAT